LSVMDEKASLDACSCRFRAARALLLLYTVLLPHQGGNTVKYALNMTTKFIPLQVMYFICYAVIDLFAMECPSHVGQYYITIMCKDG